MRLDLFLDYYEKRQFNDDQVEAGIRALTRAEGMLMKQGTCLDKATLPQIRILLDQWILDKTNDEESILALSRYFYLTNKTDLYLYFTKLTGSFGVIETIKDRFDEVMAPYHAADFLVAKPVPLGSDPKAYPQFIHEFMLELETFTTPQQTKTILCGNNHGLDKAAFQKEKEIYESSVSIDAYLLGLHQRRLAQLQDACDQKKVWFEQLITQETVDFVSHNQELLSAVHHEGVLTLTKIPYDPSSYLSQSDPIKKRYAACHCPFVREAILKGKPSVSKHWCQCSAGFEKFHFETIMDRPLEVEVLQSVLQGDLVCRFAIALK